MAHLFDSSNIIHSDLLSAVFRQVGSDGPVVGSCLYLASPDRDIDFLKTMYWSHRSPLPV